MKYSKFKLRRQLPPHSKKTPAKLSFLPNESTNNSIDVSNVSSAAVYGSFKLSDFLARYLAGDNSLKSARSISRKRLALASTELISLDHEALTLHVQHKRYLEARNVLTSKVKIKFEDIERANLILSPQSRDAGKIRTKQNWLRSIKKKITYTPPIPEEVEELLLNLIKFINNNNIPPHTKAAAVHSQFALIHPFYDGNGRIARVLWDVITQKAGLNLINPLIYRLQNTKAPYISAVRGFGLKNFDGIDCSFWQQSVDWGERYKIKVKHLMDETYHQIQSKITLLVLTDNAKKLLNHLWKQPLVHIDNLICEFGWNKGIGMNAIAELQQKNLLVARRVRHPKGEVVYENKEILELWQKLELAIFA